MPAGAEAGAEKFLHGAIFVHAADDTSLSGTWSWGKRPHMASDDILLQQPHGEKAARIFTCDARVSVEKEMRRPGAVFSVVIEEVMQECGSGRLAGTEPVFEAEEITEIRYTHDMLQTADRQMMAVPGQRSNLRK